MDANGVETFYEYLQSKPIELKQYLNTVVKGELANFYGIDTFKWVDKLFFDDAENPGVFNIAQDKYIESTYFGICEHIEEIDKIIGEHSNGWRANRLAFVSRSIIRLAVYEMLYVEEIPENVSINEAVELAKKYDDEKARAFINGVLNSVYKSLSNKKEEKAAEDAVSENE